MNAPVDINYFRVGLYRVVWQSFATIGPGMSKSRWTEINKKH